MKLIEQSAQIAAQRSKCRWNKLDVSPMVDVSRDPRWGRVSEVLVKMVLI
jgi:beta-glucosidase